MQEAQQIKTKIEGSEVTIKLHQDTLFMQHGNQGADHIFEGLYTYDELDQVRVKPYFDSLEEIFIFLLENISKSECFKINFKGNFEICYPVNSKFKKFTLITDRKEIITERAEIKSLKKDIQQLKKTIQIQKADILRTVRSEIEQAMAKNRKYLAMEIDDFRNDYETLEVEFEDMLRESLKDVQIEIQQQRDCLFNLQIEVQELRDEIQERKEPPRTNIVRKEEQDGWNFLFQGSMFERLRQGYLIEQDHPFRDIQKPLAHLPNEKSSNRLNTTLPIPIKDPRGLQPDLNSAKKDVSIAKGIEQQSPKKQIPQKQEIVLKNKLQQIESKQLARNLYDRSELVDVRVNRYTNSFSMHFHFKKYDQSFSRNNKSENLFMQVTGKKPLPKQGMYYFIVRCHKITKNGLMVGILAAEGVNQFGQEHDSSDMICLRCWSGQVSNDGETEPSFGQSILDIGNQQQILVLINHKEKMIYWIIDRQVIQSTIVTNGILDGRIFAFVQLRSKNDRVSFQ